MDTDNGVVQAWSRVEAGGKEEEMGDFYSTLNNKK